MNIDSWKHITVHSNKLIFKFELALAITKLESLTTKLVLYLALFKMLHNKPLAAYLYITKILHLAIKCRNGSSCEIYV